MPLSARCCTHAVSPARVFVKSSHVVDPYSHDVSASRFAGFAQRLRIVIKILAPPAAYSGTTRSGETSVVLDRLGFANGVALSRDEAFVAVYEHEVN
uniref:Uncharacterized protein n=1 Tax=Zea mays TaxID=4577 RepID=A0A804N5T1_MAIZE